MQRFVEPELLDELPTADPLAQGSRSDLRRVNRWMRHAEIITQRLLTTETTPTGGKIVELGAGDGTFLLSVAQRLAARWPGMKAVLVDQQSLVTAETRDGFHTLGWEMEAVKADIFDWLHSDAANRNEVIVTNLFLHHFLEKHLSELFRHAEQKTQCFVACEPRRSWLPLAVSRRLGLIGCNAVTRHDAPVSVRAGFTGGELSALWPNQGSWQLRERAAGLFSHIFFASRNPAAVA